MANKPTSFTSIELRAGLLVLITAAVLALLLAGVYKYRPQQNRNTFYVFSDDAGGLGPAADVRFGGIFVGSVTEVAPYTEDQSLIRISLSVDPSTPINTASVAFASQVTMTSAKHLEISTGLKDAPLLESGSEIPSGIGGLFGDLSGLSSTATTLLRDLKALLGVSDASGNQLLELKDGETITGLFLTLNATLEDLRILVGIVDENGQPVKLHGRKSFSELMITLDDTMLDGQVLLTEVREVIEENREGITEVLTTAKELGDSAGDLAVEAQDLMAELDTILDDNSENIEEMIENARVALASADELMIEFQSLTLDLQQLIDTNDETIEETLRDLSDTMRNLKEVTRTLSEQPQSLIRGKQPVGRQ